MIQPALFGGVFIGILSALPVVSIPNYCCCCLWILAGGVLTVYLEQQRTRRTVPPGRGAVLGLTAGVIGAFVWLVAFALVDRVVGPIEQRMIASMLQGSVDLPPDVREVFQKLATGNSSALRYIGGFAFQLVAGMIFSTVGGLLGAIFLRRDVPPPTGGDAVIELPPIPE